MRLVSLVAALLLAVTVRAEAQLFTPEDKAGYDRSAPEAGETMTRWIGFMDQRHFEAAWDGMAQVFKKEQDRATWIATQYRYRQDTYVVKARRVISSRYTRTLRPFSTIDAVTFQLAMYFVNETLGIETIVLVKEDDGAWRVASYLFNPGPITTTPAPLGY